MCVRNVCIDCTVGKRVFSPNLLNWACETVIDVAQIFPMEVHLALLGQQLLNCYV